MIGAARRTVRERVASLRVQVAECVRHNALPLYPGMRAARTVVVSPPKSGRTWLRVFLAAYAAFRRGRTAPDRRIVESERALAVFFAHDRWEHAAAPWSALLLGRCLVPSERRRDARIVLLVRDPRDALVSLHFHLTRRERWFSGTLDEMLVHPVFGIRRFIDVMNGWAAEWCGHDKALLLRYEDLLQDPKASFAAFLRFALGEIDARAFDQALAFSTFERMRELEASGYFEDRMLRGARACDPESVKVRRGKVGGYREHYSAASLAFVEGELARLDRRFGYGKREQST
jgi:hypothetical protein